MTLRLPPTPSLTMTLDLTQVVQHGGRAEATVTAETTQLVLVPQPAGACVTSAALLEALARGGALGAPTLDHLRSRIVSGQLQILSPTCAADHNPLPSECSLAASKKMKFALQVACSCKCRVSNRLTDVCAKVLNN